MNYRRRDAKDYAREHFKGIWAAALTPFAPDLAVDEAGLRRNLRHWIDDLGIDGVFVCGKQGEFFSMSVAERKRSFDIAVEELGGHRTILSCSDQNLDTVIDLAKHAQAIGADYIVVHAPVLHFSHKQDDTLYQYYQSISEQVEIGIALWSHPDSGYLMSPELCARVADIPNVVAIKYSVPRDMYARLTRLAGDKILVSTASEEEWFDNIVELGWRLYLCSSPPYLLQTKADRRMREYTDLAFRGEIARAKAVRDSLDPVRAALRRTRPAEKFHAHSKCWQELLGQAGGAVRRPLLELTQAERDATRRAFELPPETRRAQPTLVGGLIEGGDMRRLHAFNFQNWINQNQHLLKPPVGNKKVFEDGEMTVQVVGGPNERTDYHDDPVEEFFYQLKGDMLLKVVDNGNFYDVPIREGEVFLLPAHVRHSPQRPQEGSVGLVVEAARPDELDAFEWYCFDCRALVHRIEVKVEHLVKDLPPLYEAFYADEKARKCKNCGAIHPGKRPPPGWVKI
jgi:4-hydroxy-tetrahydrodipicolinate synthase